MTWAISTPENLFGWVKGAMKDLRDELDLSFRCRRSGDRLEAARGSGGQLRGR